MNSISSEVELSLNELTPEIDLFKIFGSSSFTFDKAYSESKVDWSGFYTQLNPEHSMRYLTKKWDDGADEACLILLKPIKKIKLIKIQDKQFFSDPKVSGEEKALRIKESLRKRTLENKEKFKDFYIKNEEILMKSLGEREALLECIDMDENEIIIPHDILNEKYFEFKSLLVFKKSNDGLLRTIGWKWGEETNEESDWRYIKGECQYEPYMILEEEKFIKFFLEEKKNSSSKLFRSKKI